MHRLARVGPDLDRVEAYAVVSPSDRAAVASLRADVAFHSGRYDEARTLYEAQLARGRTASALAAYAQWFWKTGDPRRAEALLREAAAASEREPASTRAWICLVQGLFELDRGRHDAALAHYRRGLEHTPNDWLLQEHLAEALALRGDGVIALPLYERLVDRTGSPEFMDAVAEILLERGDREAAAPWIARARAAWEERLALYPEAAYGHALDHWLTLEREPERTVQMAEANAEARPNGESLTKLAQALLAAGRTADARRAIEQVLASRWSTPETHELAAQVYDAAGEPRLAQRQRDRAAALR
jgi:Tfp pilus assembly protein PilF